MGKKAEAKPAAAKPAAKPAAKADAKAAKPAAKADAKTAKPTAGGGKADAKAAAGQGKAGAGPSKADKAAKKAEKEAAEQARRSARDAMLPPSGDEYTSEEEAGEEDGGMEAARAQAIAEREQAKQEEEARQLRAAEARAAKAGPTAAAASEAGGYPKAASRLAKPLAPRPVADDADEQDSDEDEDAGKGGASRAEKAAKAEAKMLEKVEKGGKLSNKERRLHQKYLQKQDEQKEEMQKQQALQEEPPEVQQWLKELEPFTLHVPGARQDGEGNAVGEGGDAVAVEGFSLSAPGQELLKDASLTLSKGKRYGLLGPNGMGKTTLLKHLATRRFPIPAGWSVALVAQEASASTRSVVDEVLAADVTRGALAKEEEELMAKLEDFSPDGAAEDLTRLCDRLADVAAGLEACGAEAAEAKVRQILVGLQFTEEMMEGPVKRLSGGWRMRVSLAKALFLAPDLLLLDEPTNHLDLDAVLWLDDYLSTEFKNTILVVSHDADFLDSVCTDVVHLEEQRLQQYRGGYTMFKKMHAQRLQEREREYKKLVDQGKKATGSKARQIDKEEIEKVRPQKTYTVKFNFLPLVTDKDEAGISVHDINFSWSGKKPWLLGGPPLNFRIDASMRIAVVGRNGAGKSTLLDLLTKHNWPTEGEVCHSRGLSIGRYTQHFDELGEKEALTPVELLTHPDVRRFGAGIEKKEQAHKSLGQFGLPTHAHTRPIKELSGGQKARVQFALLTCRRPEILVLDEPTNHLDIESVEEIIAALRRYEGGFVLVSHDARLITSTQAALWEVDGTGAVKVRGEGQQGFEEYRRKVLREIERRRLREEQLAEKRAQARKKKREEMLKRGAKKK